MLFRLVKYVSKTETIFVYIRESAHFFEYKSKCLSNEYTYIMTPYWTLLVLPFFVSTARVHVELYLKCDTMYTTETHVFLMEEDGGADGVIKNKK